MKRIFLFDGQVTDRIDTYEDASVLSADDHACQEVADALGVTPDRITTQHVEADPQVAVTIPPAVAAPLVSTALEQLITALATEPALSTATKDTLMAITGGADIALAVPLTPSKR